MKKKSFANRLILSFAGVVFLGFLGVYFLFNAVVDNYIRSEAAAELNREILTANTAPAINIGGGGIWMQSPGFHVHRTIVNVNTIIVDSYGTLLIPDPASLAPEDMLKMESLIAFWVDNRANLATSEDMMQMTHADHAFYLRATGISVIGNPLLELPMLYAIMYTDVTPAMNLKAGINQILLGLLALSGTLTLTISVVLVIGFKRSINKLATRAQIIGSGDFEQKNDNFSYREFANLADDMNEMATMLGHYETTQKQFFQNASHELRTPLMSIQGYTEGIKSGVFEHHDAATDIILEESQKMTGLIDDILYLSRLGASQATTGQTAIVTVENLIERCVGRTRMLAQKADKQIITSIETVANLELNTKQDMLERAILNILTNAIRYAETEIQVSVVPLENQLKITISNDGPLINETDLPQIFDRFYKGPDGNTGLGLAITKDIISHLGGEIEVSNLNDTVQFAITLPR